VAESLHRPLYYVTSGELGTGAGGLEPRIQEVFRYIVRWRAVLLFDEADVFMARRNFREIDRNALVSGAFCIFLHSKLLNLNGANTGI